MKFNPVFAAVCLSVLSGCSATQLTETKQTDSPAVASFLPKAPIGYQWQLIENMSDEFNGDSLNQDKWLNYIPTWRGRPPAKFLKENVTVNNGNLELKTSTYSGEDKEDFTMGGAAVSGKYGQTFGYFESRVKASKTKLSTTFWLHSDKAENPKGDCENRHSIEIDILEAIGGWPQAWWANMMHSNTHYKPSALKDGKCRGADYLSKGVKYDTKRKLSDDFNTYAAWWVTPNQVHYYYNGILTGTVNLTHEKDPVAFNGDMSLRMVAETYTWQQKLIKNIPGNHLPYPTAAELNDASINTAYYDHVRSYQLVPMADNLLVNPDFEDANLAWQFASGATISAAAKHSYTQGKGLRVQGKATAQQTVKVNTNSHYRLTGYSRNQEVNAGGKIVVKDQQQNIIATSLINTTEFKLSRIEFNTANNSQITVEIQGSRGNVSLVDNLALIKM
ncbi:family 16 glycosylhydrolase [Algibacillus agarilyticus]|uniref:family 16 glycosylhydrolase n=1 Tax=Algibacillus agarilyticus TaxID=2234133 RepID=UPI00130069C2|nr:family 16 glycosylhydrolase [Algibacillus agarilyticus]